jgi:hypothetical protein
MLVKNCELLFQNSKNTYGTQMFFSPAAPLFFPESLKTNSTMKHTIKSARYMWNYVAELTFDDNRVALFDFERVVRDNEAPAYSIYRNKGFFERALRNNGETLSWHDDMVFDANWLYALMPDAAIERFSATLPLTVYVNYKA